MKKFAKESAKTRLSRDVFIYDPKTMEFLVKPWGSGNHRAVSKYGNAFGTFLYRPPKDESDLAKQKDISSEMYMKGEGIVLKYDMSEGVISWKTKELNKLIKKKQFPYDKTTFLSVIMPSKEQCRTSSIAAPMTILAYFYPVSKDKLNDIGNYEWLSRIDATDPTLNVHADVVSMFLYKKDIKNLKTLQGKNVEKIMKLVH